jgi:uncharacterized protein YabE (DUF348 family)
MSLHKKAIAAFVGLGLPLQLVIFIVLGCGLVGAIGSSDVSEYSVTKIIPFNSDATEDDSVLDTEPELILTQGKNGSQVDHYKIHKVAGVTTSKTYINTTNYIQPVTEKAKFGILHKSQVNGDQQTVDFGTDYQNDSSMDKGTTKVLREGVPGSKHAVYEVLSVKGVEKSRKQIDEIIDTQPISKLIAVGTKVAIQTNCDPNYSPCIPYYAGNALNCPDIGIRVRVIGYDHNRFDADGDGWGCDAYGG